MKCPVCDNVRMREVEKDGVLIDVCTECKGVWLDRGELDKLLSEIREIRPAFNEWYGKREGESEYDRKEVNRHSPNLNQGSSSQSYQAYDHRDQKHGYNKGHQHKKKKSVLDVFGDLFD
ncbi:Zn-finger nucleic acid-binding protein [Paenibacillus anaericanus]|uniref:TFIIB-type zinc ribbon-containing protein n=1 Tax=Paenibacillus anaericanus TaxID=170367 RepID=UPI00277D57CD|nr:zf-TFIIB domain-containing protein [Paenibacillus anaericanus]MDQ0091849.1 Zn-finger nucleic acid-binding protein [Paenibacillus anaericanus]